MKPSCLIVMYHYVGNYDDHPGIHAVSDGDFAGQVDALSKTMEPIDWPALYAWTQGKGKIPDRCFLLTFDDGLLGQEGHATTVLEERGIRGTFLVPGRVLMEPRVLLAAHAVHLLLSKVDADELEHEIVNRVPAPLLVAGAATMWHYEPRPVVARIKYLLTVVLPRDPRETLIRELFRKHIGSMEDYALRWYMNVSDLRRMQAAGHTIGGHGFSHEPYGGMTQTEQLDDMMDSHAILSSKLDGVYTRNRPLYPRPFSYPYGQYKGGAERACRTAGFATAFTTERRCADDTCGPYRLPRVDAMYLEANNDAGFTVEPKAADGPVPAVSGVRED